MTMLVSVLIFAASCGTDVSYGYRYRRDIGNEWTLADRAANIPEKAEHVQKFVTALEKADLSGEYNALWMTEPSVSFDANFDALKGLLVRLNEIKDMDPSSFQYNTAIQQITAQEQGEADGMLAEFHGCWYKKNAPLILWGWVSVAWYIFLLAVIVISGGIWLDGSM